MSHDRYAGLTRRALLRAGSLAGGLLVIARRVRGVEYSDPEESTGCFDPADCPQKDSEEYKEGLSRKAKIEAFYTELEEAFEASIGNKPIAFGVRGPAKDAATEALDRSYDLWNKSKRCRDATIRCATATGSFALAFAELRVHGEIENADYTDAHAAVRQELCIDGVNSLGVAC